MQEIKITKTMLAATGLLSLLALGLPGAAQAAPEHEVSVKLEFVDAPACADTTIVFAAASCDRDEILSELKDKMGSLGFGATICGHVVNPEERWECAYTEPAGCDQVDIEVSVLVGTDCPQNIGTVSFGEVIASIGSFWFRFE